MNIDTSRYTDAAHGVLRIVAGFLFWIHGTQKLLGWFGGMDGEGATVQIASLFGVAGVLELVGGTLIVLGLFTRPVAFILSGEMAVAYFIQHFPQSPWPVLNGGEPAALFCFIFLFFAAAGGGAFSLDRTLRKRRTG